LLRLEPASRNGFSLPRNDCPFPGRHSGIEVPSLLLRCFAEFSPSPFGLRLLRSFRLAPDWARSPPQARFSAEIPQSRSVPTPPLPFRVFCTPPDQRISAATNQGLASRMCPIAFRSPPPFYWNSSTADQRSRLASLPFGLLFPELKISTSPRFSRAVEGAPDAPEAGALCRPPCPISGQPDSRALLARQQE